MKDAPSTSISNYNQSQPDSHIPGTEIDFDTTTGTYTPVHKDEECCCRSIELSYSATEGGYVVVHLLKDPDDVFYTMHLEPGEEKGRLFDRIIQTGTTVDVDSLVLFPALFY